MYVYILSGKWVEGEGHKEVFEVGFYKPDGVFETDSEYQHKDDAAARVHYLNGGMPGYELEILTRAAGYYIASRTSIA